MARVAPTDEGLSTRGPSPSLRAPLLWLVVPFMAGICLAAHLGSLAPAGLGLVLGTALLIFAFVAVRSKRLAALTLPGLAVGACLLGVGWLGVRTPPDLYTWQQLPPREAELTLRIDRLIPRDDPYNRVSAVATVTQAPTHLHELLTQKLQCLLVPRVETEALTTGTQVRVRGQLSFLPARIRQRHEMLNTGQTDLDPVDLRNWLAYDTYLVRSGIHFSLSRGYILEQVNPAPRHQRWLQATAESINASLHQEANDARTQRLADLAAAMALGRKDLLTPEQKERFGTAGVMHLFAISGLHVGVVAGLLFFMLRLLGGWLLPTRVRTRRLIEFLTGVALLWVYVGVTGFAPSAVRAWLMVGTFWSARVFRRRGAPLAALAFSALLVLIWEPRQLFSLGFQLSYAVVAGILLYGAPLADALNTRWAPFKDLPEASLRFWQRARRTIQASVLSLVCISVAALILGAPLTIGTFNRFAFAGVVLNILLIPLASLALCGALLSAVFGLGAFAPVSAFFNHGTWLILWLMEAVVIAAEALAPLSLQLQWRFDGLGEALVVAVLALLCLRPIQRQPAKRSWTRAVEAPALLAVCLLFGTRWAG